MCLGIADNAEEHVRPYASARWMVPFKRITISYSRGMTAMAYRECNLSPGPEAKEVRGKTMSDVNGGALEVSGTEPHRETLQKDNAVKSEASERVARSLRTLL